MNKSEQIESLLDRATDSNRLSNTQSAVADIISVLTVMNEPTDTVVYPPSSVVGLSEDE